MFGRIRCGVLFLGFFWMGLICDNGAFVAGKKTWCFNFIFLKFNCLDLEEFGVEFCL